MAYVSAFFKKNESRYFSSYFFYFVEDCNLQHISDGSDAYQAKKRIVIKMDNVVLVFLAPLQLLQ